MIERMLIGVIVTMAVVQSLRVLLPLKARASLGKRLAGRIPDRVLIWWAGQQSCEACGGDRRPEPFQRTK